MMKAVGLAALALGAWIGLAWPAAGAASDAMSIVSDGETVGSLLVHRDGAAVEIDYRVDENGRGPKHTEHLMMGAGGIPVGWTIDGTTMMGGPVHEQLTWQRGRVRWTSQADTGDIPAASPLLYIANDASPWALGLYARALLQTPKGELDVLPKGQLKIEKLRPVSLDRKAKGLKLDAYVLSGINLTPDILLLDSRRDLFAVLDQEMLVRKGYESLYVPLMELYHQLSRERLMQLQQQIAHRYDIPVRIRNVHVFDPTAMKMGPTVSVVFHRGRITTIEPDGPAPSDEVVIDGQGGSLIPGLHDMHAHAAIWDEPLDIAAGVTTIRDMGNNNQTLPRLMDDIDTGKLAGPHIIPSGFIEGRSPFSARDGFVIATQDEGLRAVHWYADRGYIQIKIYNSMNPAFVKPLADEARGLGLRTVGHVPAFATPDEMIEAGYNEITHVNQLMLGWLLKPGEDTRTPLRLTAMARAADLDLADPKVQHTLALMKEHEVGLDTTISIVEQLMMSRAGETPANAAAYIDHLPIGLQRYKRRSYVTFKDEGEKQQYAKAFAKALDVMAMLHREGIRLWPGTDASIGFTLQRELELYTLAGVPAAEALKIATLDCDAYLGRDQDYGSIVRAKRADFFLVPGDPTKDINAIRMVRMVVKDGTIYYPNEIYRAYGVVPFATSPAVVLPKLAASGDMK